MKKNVVLGVTGSIAAYKACDILRRLQDKGFSVRVVMSPCAEKFVTPLTFEALSQAAVAKDMFDREAGWDMAHISLAKWADIYLIAPATANVIGKIAHGLADDLVSCSALSIKAPIVIAPAMNTAMFTNSVVQENLAALKRYGIDVIDPKSGRLACGDEGVGAMADVDMIVDRVVDLLK